MNGSINALPTQLTIPGLHMGPPNAPATPGRPPALDRLRTLLIDDSDFVRDVTVETLTSLGVRHIQCATDGWDALLHMTRDPVPPDVILCDLAMPCMDGLEFIRHLGTRAYGGAIILISGHSERLLGSACELVRSLDLRLSGAIKKPLAPKVLEGLLAASATPATAARAGARAPDLT
jgi:CheY-like chemotaxis protein